MLPLYKMTYKRLYGDKLKEFLKSAPLGKISKADRKVMEKKARRWAWEQVQALQARDTVVPPPGYAEMGKTEKAFPVQQMKAFAKEQLDELRAGSAQVSRSFAQKVLHEQQAVQRSKTREQARCVRSRQDDEHSALCEGTGTGSALSHQPEGMVGVQDLEQMVERRAAERAERHAQRRATNKRETNARWRKEGVFSAADRKRHIKAQRILRQRRGKGGGRQGPANEQERLLKKLRRKGGRRPRRPRRR